jgi:hypothetical protein
MGKCLLADEVLGAVENAKPGHRTWFEMLPTEAQEELDAARNKFDPAIHQKRAFALAVIKAATKRGWKIAAEKQVIAWLDGKR